MKRNNLRRIVAAAAALALIPVMASGNASATPAVVGSQGMAKGRLLQADGRPAAGALVDVYAQPVETAEHHFNQGDSGTLTMVGQVRADHQGRYAAAVKRASLTPFRGPGGNVNLLLIARDASGHTASMSFGLAPVAPVADKTAESGALSAEGPALEPVAISDLTLDTPDQTVAANSSPGATVPAAAGRGGDPATELGDPGAEEPKKWVLPLPSTDPFVNGTGGSANVASPSIVVCSWILVSDLGPKTVWVGGTYVRATGVSADLQYSSGASSSLGVGVSTTGAYGSYSASGTMSIASTGSIDYPTNYGFQHDYTQFVYGKYGYSCDIYPGYKQYQVRARYWAGGASTYSPSTAPSVPYCLSYGSGVTVTQQTSMAYTFSTGADTSGSIGIDLSSQSGYSSTLKLVFRFTATRHLCGTNGYPGASPGRLVAQV
ncbi:hypothetical protein [Nostocoides sp. HKS02]|uniref:hypothetical protein n=1 Tax=Nostocoides sp. HKS02 TaxID=1813880 RepID=UPI0012B4DCE7|nr:hypothetical protein [Tetrasphaera sp. HKS02]QGN59036.1 hypothetical protein GKE56_15380 [Tetrasphaera sp. HKS02]